MVWRKIGDKCNKTFLLVAHKKHHPLNAACSNFALTAAGPTHTHTLNGIYMSIINQVLAILLLLFPQWKFLHKMLCNGSVLFSVRLHFDIDSMGGLCHFDMFISKLNKSSANALHQIIGNWKCYFDGVVWALTTFWINTLSII